MHDANGNLDWVNSTSESNYSFDAENRLTQRTYGASTVSYRYDGHGELVERTTSGPSGSETVVMVGGLYEKNLQTGEVTKYYRAFGRAIAMRTVPASGPQSVRYLLADHLGSTTAVVDSSGALLSKRSYWPYGNERSLSGDALLTDRWFTGQRDESFDGLGLYHYEARAMSTVSGRFLSPDGIVPDPMNPQSPNRYSYVLNNPLRYTDPTGREYLPNTDLTYCLIGLGSDCAGATAPNFDPIMFTWVGECYTHGTCLDVSDYDVCVDWGCTLVGFADTAATVLEFTPVGDACIASTGNTRCFLPGGHSIGGWGRGLAFGGLFPWNRARFFAKLDDLADAARVSRPARTTTFSRAKESTGLRAERNAASYAN